MTTLHPQKHEEAPIALWSSQGLSKEPQTQTTKARLRRSTRYFPMSCPGARSRLSQQQAGQSPSVKHSNDLSLSGMLASTCRFSREEGWGHQSRLLLNSLEGTRFLLMQRTMYIASLHCLSCIGLSGIFKDRTLI